MAFTAARTESRMLESRLRDSEEQCAVLTMRVAQEKRQRERLAMAFHDLKRESRSAAHGK